MNPKVVPHVHFHVIPKPEQSDKSGLVIGWPTQEIPKEDLEKYHKELLGKL
jgi:diadenosine tetraphosphate (Ap4A) HIT family hydrolase